MSSLSSSGALTDAEDLSKPATLAKEFSTAATGGDMWWNRTQQNWQSRYTWWPGQSQDGRKWQANYGQPVFPWDGASDVRYPLVDTYILEDSAMLVTGLFQSRLSALPTEGNDTAKAANTTNFLRWMLFNQMTELPREAELLANYMLERPVAVMGVFWDKQEQLVRHDITLPQIAEMVAEAEADSDLAMLPRMIINEGMDDATVAMLERLLPDVKPKVLRKLVKDLRTKGEGSITVAETVKDRPSVVALCHGEDFFAPPEVTNLEDARCLFWREFCTEAMLRDRVDAMGYDEHWVEQVVQRGKGAVTQTGFQDTKRMQGGLPYQRLYDTTNLIEVVHGYYKQADDDGITQLKCSVFCPAVLTDERDNSIVAKDELLDYAHGEYPFILFRREDLGRRLTDSRGYGEVAYTWQWQVKQELDMQIDRAQLATCPPLHHPPGKAPNNWGPFTKVPTLRQGEYSFADIPKFDPGSMQVTATMKRIADQYFGRAVPDADGRYAVVRTARMMQKWLQNWNRVATQVLQLCQQYMPESFWFRVVGNAKGAQKMNREEIMGKYDVTMTFNPMNLDPNYTEQKIKAISEAVAALDVNGITNRDELLTYVIETIEPSLAERLIKPGEEASQGEIEDEKAILGRLLQGMEENVKPGQAYQLRLQVLQNEIASNPVAQTIIAGNERVREVVEKRIQQLTFQLQQRQNAVIGRLGA